MDDITLIVVAGVTALNTVAFIAGYIWGSYNERKDWNRLINEGGLPGVVVEPHSHYATVKYSRR